MKDLRLTESDDLLLCDDGDIAVTDSVSQAIRIRLRWFLGEWKFNKGLGVPYYEEILVKNPSKLHTEQVIRETVLSVCEVTEVSEIEVIRNSAQRTMTVRFVATVGGQLLREEMRFDA